MPSVLITGVSSGLGRALAARFCREGWEVTGTVRTLEGAGVQGHPPGVRLRVLDLARPESISELAAEVTTDEGAPDVLINNAGMLHFGPLEDAPLAAIQSVFQVNAFGPIALALAFVPGMRERGSGLIVNVGSLGGRMVFPFFSVYNASKHALEGFSEGLWHELKPFGVNVKIVRPGYIDTPIYEKASVDRAGVAGASQVYRDALTKILEFERRVTRRTRPEEAAEELWVVVNDTSDRLAYPIAAYARSLLLARRLIGETRFLRIAHGRWFGGS